MAHCRSALKGVEMVRRRIMPVLGLVLCLSTACTDGAGEPSPARTPASVAAALATVPPSVAPGSGPVDQVSGYAVPDLLRSRVLRPPPLGPKGSCLAARPRRVSASFGPASGPGPVYPVGMDATGRLMAQTDLPRSRSPSAAFVAYIKVLWIVDNTAYTGPVLIRGISLDGRDPVRFDDGPDPADAMQFPPRMPVMTGSDPGWFDRPSYTRLRAEGCYAWQVDGLEFSYTVVFQAVGWG
jgi:hypothetical protein